ncbi:MAG TPA: Asp-tRNA(Asn)/Glu-tRNA(Gln) amidotransferase subunit GatC [Candidatus Saccharimonadales bacterium]|jgi:aspartyl-tRNA(Asn)/glutamyl-tRNA(Gln) amidotransferase subunit C|nr:Asp-tRNA(Asn)/Glu-tRNA(Gln) amidotransferase subunit GatC [Candidatus Saccharimonadales bacterium]
MSQVTIDDVKKVAVLSGLALADDEFELYRDQFNEILSYVEQLNAVDLTGLEPTYQVTGLSNVTRPDDIIDYGIGTKELLENAPDSQDNQIKVRRVLG